MTFDDWYLELRGAKQREVALAAWNAAVEASLRATLDQLRVSAPVLPYVKAELTVAIMRLKAGQRVEQVIQSAL